MSIPLRRFLAVLCWERRLSCVGATVSFLSMVLAGAMASGQEQDLPWMPSDVTKTLGGFIQQKLTLSTNRPAAVKKLPASVTSPLYGELRIGPREKPATYFVVLDEPKGKSSRLYLDANGNGDLGDDEAVTWNPRSNPDAGGGTSAVYVGETMVSIPYPSGPVKAKLGFYRVNAGNPANGAAADVLFYYRDYGRHGPVKIGGQITQGMLVDEFASGDFRGEEGKPFSGVRLLLDLNQDGRFDVRREAVDVRQPFNIGGTNWEFAKVTADGKFQIVPSTKIGEELKVAPNLSPGAKVIPFTAKTLGGATVKFPDDYKGKLVLLDFWATWCGPCLAELPNVVANYAKYHPKGFEILGISLDKESGVATLPQFTKEKNMPWPQICDGKMWEAELGQRYGVESIPFMLLVDGDSGQILGDTMAIRGENLAPAIEAGLKRLNAARK